MADMPRTRSLSPLRASESFFRWQHSRRPSSNISSLPKDLDKLDEESALIQLNVDAARLRREVQQLHERNTQLEFENLSLREDVDAVQEMLKTTEMAKAELEQQMEELTASTAKMQEDKLALMRKLEAERQEAAEVQKGLENYIEVLTEELQQVSEAEAKHHGRKSRTNSFAPMGGPCNSCRMYRQDLKTAYELQASLEGELARLRLTTEAARDRLQEAEAELEIQRENNAVYKEEQEELAAGLSQVIAKLPASIQRENHVTNNLQANLGFLAHNVGYMTLQLMGYEDDCEILKMELAAKSTRVAELAELSDFLKKEKNNVVKVWRLQGQVKEMEEQLAAKERRIRELARQNTKPWYNSGWVPAAERTRRTKRATRGRAGRPSGGGGADSAATSVCHSRQHSMGSSYMGGGSLPASAIHSAAPSVAHSKQNSHAEVEHAVHPHRHHQHVLPALPPLHPHHQQHHQQGQEVGDAAAPVPPAQQHQQQPLDLAPAPYQPKNQQQPHRRHMRVKPPVPKAPRRQPSPKPPSASKDGTTDGPPTVTVTASGVAAGGHGTRAGVPAGDAAERGPGSLSRSVSGVGVSSAHGDEQHSAAGSSLGASSVAVSPSAAASTAASTSVVSSSAREEARSNEQGLLHGGQSGVQAKQQQRPPLQHRRLASSREHQTTRLQQQQLLQQRRRASTGSSTIPSFSNRGAGLPPRRAPAAVGTKPAPAAADGPAAGPAASTETIRSAEQEQQQLQEQAQQQPQQGNQQQQAEGERPAHKSDAPGSAARQYAAEMAAARAAAEASARARAAEAAAQKQAVQRQGSAALVGGGPALSFKVGKKPVWKGLLSKLTH